jgi:hypothetical protein
MKINFMHARDLSDPCMRVLICNLSSFKRHWCITIWFPGYVPASDYAQSGKWKKRGFRLYACRRKSP